MRNGLILLALVLAAIFLFLFFAPVYHHAGYGCHIGDCPLYYDSPILEWTNGHRELIGAAYYTPQFIQTYQHGLLLEPNYGYYELIFAEIADWWIPL
jgi:hypothetical protein